MKQRRLENPNPVLSEGRDVLISLGPQSFKVRKADLRDNSAYFAEFPNDQFPKRFTLVPGGDVDDVVGWRLLPKGTSEDDGATTEEDQLDNDASKQACEVHEVILGLMCPPLQYSHLLRSERSAFIISISKRIAAYECTSEVNDTFIGKILMANISANLFDIDPCLLLQIANNLRHEELFSTAMPHVVGRFCIFREEVQEMSVKLQRCVAVHVEAFQDENLSLRSKIEDCLAIPEKPSTIFAAHLIRRHFIYRHDYVVFLEDATHPTVFEALRDLCNLQDVGSAVSY
ncbi:hypothetical protein SLS56_011208 [Neofusicoccum ribis]|uniref:BTB domain-containing protein n=1 Tax=Neofusicoccum ribis TaxID=45134 RepID=A0ABR3SCV1_9PEZI